jgi:hypothetical protein
MIGIGRAAATPAARDSFSEQTLFFYGDLWNDNYSEVRIEAISSPFAPPGRTAMLRGLIAFAVLAGLTCSFAEAQVLTGDTHLSTTTSHGPAGQVPQ